MEPHMSGKRPEPEEQPKEESKKGEVVPIYYFKDGYRYVEDHIQILKTHTKRRWIGSTIWNVLTREFKLYTPEYYENAINSGKITINGKKCSKTQILKDGDLIVHELVRSERRVFDSPIEIIMEDGNYVVVNKPSSIPVHAGGPFHFNSLSLILQYEMGYKNLLMGHRLDRQTSGICLFSKNKEAAQKYSKLLQEEGIHKVYIARAVGKFLESVFTIRKRILFVITKKKKDMYHVSEKDAIHDCADQKEAINGQKQYKEAVTDFKVISYDPVLDMSVLKCYPRTGRTHQIRVHLKSIGHPIENDKVYRTIYEIEQDLEIWKAKPDKEKVYKGIGFKINEKGKVIPNVPGEDFEEIYLHAYKYKFGKYKLKTKYPDWAKLPNVVVKEGKGKVLSNESKKEQKGKETM